MIECFLPRIDYIARRGGIYCLGGERNQIKKTIKLNSKTCNEKGIELLHCLGIKPFVGKHRSLLQISSL